MAGYASKRILIVGAVILVAIGYFVFAERNEYDPPPGTIGPLTESEMKYLVLGRYPNIFWCDSDFYPVARQDEQALAIERFPELRGNKEEFTAIIGHLGFTGKTNFTDEEKLAIYRDHKRLKSFTFEPTGSVFAFRLQLQEEDKIGYGTGTVIEGTIGTDGAMRITRREEGFIVSCPICLAEGTLIDTPIGSVPVELLKTGMTVWTLDASGKRIAAPVLRTSRTKAPPSHEVVEILLNDGRSFTASPRHPFADGRLVGNLAVGDLLAGSRIARATRIPYRTSHTYDLLPGGETGIYFADGVPLMSTLKR